MKLGSSPYQTPCAVMGFSTLNLIALASRLECEDEKVRKSKLNRSAERLRNVITKASSSSLDAILRGRQLSNIHPIAAS